MCIEQGSVRPTLKTVHSRVWHVYNGVPAQEVPLRLVDIVNALLCDYPVWIWTFGYYLLDRAIDWSIYLSIGPNP